MTFGNILSAVKLASLLVLVAAVLWYRHEAHTERKARIVAQHSIEAIKGAQRASLALEQARFGPVWRAVDKRQLETGTRDE